MKSILIVCFTICPFLLFGQVLLWGTVLDQSTKAPLPLANVFVGYTTAGGITDAQGRFELEVMPGEVELIVSFVGYETYQKKFILTATEGNALTIVLKPLIVDLATVEVTAQRRKKRKRYLKRFTSALFGRTTFARHCELKNPEVLDFQYEGKLLTASARDLLEIDNQALGYKLYFLLESFRQKGDEVTYSGKPYFVPLEAQNIREQERWVAHRQQAYRGSLPHFLRALVRDELAAEGFLLKRAILKPDRSLEIVEALQAKDIIQNGHKDWIRQLQYEGLLQVVYTEEEDPFARKQAAINAAPGQLGQAAEREMIQQEFKQLGDGQPQVSYLFMRKSSVPLDSSGYLLRPELLVEYGYWSNERVADLLPRDYGLDLVPTVTKRDSFPPLHGFRMQHLRIPYAEIKRGGPPRGGIPAIDQPHFVKAVKADFLSDDDPILGVVINGEARAYPVRIMDYHEIVNDYFGDQAVAVTYCPLCGSGMTFVAEVGERSRTFGVSGLLYNSDVLLYDRETESLWSQILGQAISGPASGAQLQLLPTLHTTWSAWRAKYPQTKVLSTNTGYVRNYTGSAYADYHRNDQLMFPVAQENSQLARKAKVIGLSLNSLHKAYPLKDLAKAKQSPILDELGGLTIQIHFDTSSQAVQITNAEGQLLPATRLYWFAWFAFHPDTEVYKFKK